MHTVIDNVISRILAQQEKGLQKYGTPVNPEDYTLQGWIEHQAQEMSDALVYLECQKQLIDLTLKDLYTAIKEMEASRTYSLELGNAYYHLCRAIRRLGGSLDDPKTGTEKPLGEAL